MLLLLSLFVSSQCSLCMWVADTVSVRIPAASVRRHASAERAARGADTHPTGRHQDTTTRAARH